MHITRIWDTSYYTQVPILQFIQYCKQTQWASLAASCSSLATSDSASKDGFGSFTWNLKEKAFEEIKKNYFSQTSELRKAYTKEQLSGLAFQAWKLCLQEISANSEDTSVLILSEIMRQIRALCLWCHWSQKDFFRCSKLKFTYANLYNYNDYEARLWSRWIESLQRPTGL